MKYKIKCSNCGKTFAAETDKYGKNKFRCPYCGTILLCNFEEPTPLHTTARKVIPLSVASPITKRQIKDMPQVESKLLHTPSKEALLEMRSKLLEASQHIPSTSVHAGSILKNATNYTSKFVAKSSSRLIKFQEKYKDGDLWIFFGASFAFIVLTIACLLAFAELTKLLAEGHSWVFKYYIELRNML